LLPVDAVVSAIAVSAVDESDVSTSVLVAEEEPPVVTDVVVDPSVPVEEVAASDVVLPCPAAGSSAVVVVSSLDRVVDDESSFSLSPHAARASARTTTSKEIKLSCRVLRR
jgi:hypothetical protein